MRIKRVKGIKGIKGLKNHGCQMTDLQDLKQRLDLIAEVEKDLGPGKRSGKWVLFSCPFPGHAHGDRNPSLGIANDRYYCFTCQASGDVLTWLLDYRQMTWKEIHELTGSTDLPPVRMRPPQPGSDDHQGPPAEQWQARGRAFLEDCRSALWGTGGEKALAYLKDRRGLREETIRYWGLGFNPTDSYSSLADWGLAEQAGLTVWLPRGIVIPAFVGGDLYYLNIRRAAGKPKYHKVKGSRAALFGTTSLRGSDLALLVEGEFDCILADQEIGDVAGVATLGSASKRLNLSEWGKYLLPAKVILAALDSDGAGCLGGAGLAGLSSRIRTVKVPVLNAGGKDISDYVQAGGDLWLWLKYNLERLELFPVLARVGAVVGLQGSAEGAR